MGSINKRRLRLPGSPTSFEGSAVAQATLLLSWSQPSVRPKTVVSYALERFDVGGYSAIYAGAALAFSDTGLDADTTYSYRVAALDGAGQVSAWTSANAATLVAASGWLSFGDVSFTEDPSAAEQYFDLTDYAPAGEDLLTSTGDPFPAWITLDSDNKRLVYTYANDTEAPRSAATTTNNHRITSTTTAEDDWNTRISGAGVVFYHSFENDAEVGNFRMVAGWQSDPTDIHSTTIAPGTGYVRRTTADPSFPNGCLHQQAIAGQPGNIYQWWRPFAPLTGTANGRGTPDPGGSIAVQTDYVVGTNQHDIQGKYAWTHPSNTYDGTIGTGGFYFQYRLKFAANRFTAPMEANGKISYICHDNGSFQEIIHQPIPEDLHGGTASAPGFFTIYSDYGAADGTLEEPQAANLRGLPITNYMPGNEGGFSGASKTPGQVWQMPTDEWITFLWYIEPGDDVSSQSVASKTEIESALANPSFNKTKIIVWAAASNLVTGRIVGGQFNGYTKIWDKQDYVLNYGSPFYPPGKEGYNFFKFAQYTNGHAFSSDTYHRLAQFIFSTNPIPCPQDGIT